VTDADSGMVDPNIALLQIPTIESGGQGGIGKSFIGLIPELPKLQQPKKPVSQAPTPVRVGILEPSKLIYKVSPVYPALASRAHVQGTVVLEAVVDEEGSVSTLKVLSGHPLLVDAALQAVKQWRYSPTVMNGEPVPVIATVTVIFRLN
jgi:protein TonB